MHMINNKSTADMIYLDCSNAFDKVDHGILLHKLRDLGITDRLGLWFFHFLNNRQHYVRMPGGISQSRKKLMSMPRRVQRSIWRLKMRCPTYSQVTTRQPLRCRWCDEDYNSITTHWLRHCPAMMYWQERMAARLKEHECDLDDREAITAILNSQNAVDYEEINGLLRNFPLPEPNS